MIAAPLAYADKQTPGLDAFTRAFAFLRRADIATLAEGRHPIDGDTVFALVQRYATEAPAEPKFEAHRAYIDVQFVAEGEEVIGWAPLAWLELEEAYDKGRDACFGRACAWTPVRLRKGDFAVFYPEDAHAPRLAQGAPGQVTKVVVKIAIAAAI